MHPNVHYSTFYNSQDMETTLMSINKWMDKEDVVYINIYNGIVLSHKKEWSNAKWKTRGRIGELLKKDHKQDLARQMNG